MSVCHDVRGESPNCLSHCSQAKMGLQPFPDKLYVITAISNPMRFVTRYELYRAFEKRVADAGAELITIEAAFGDRPYEITSAANPNHIQVRSNSEIWLKENLINLAISRLPEEARYIAWVDADLQFTRPDWAQETIQQLQHHDFVQMFSHIINLGPSQEFLGDGISFMHGWRSGHGLISGEGVIADATFYRPSGEIADDGYSSCVSSQSSSNWAGAPGGAWAATREALDAVGGLIDWVPIGSADYYMARALFGLLDLSIDGGGSYYNPSYIKMLVTWQRMAMAELKNNVGHVNGTIFHHWHGKTIRRGYESRWKILAKHDFDPMTDLKRNSYGVLELAGNKPQLRDDLRSYFFQRSEDGIDV